MAAKLEIRLFGGLLIGVNGSPLSGFISAKIPALFAYLALTRRPHQRDALAALLWGELSNEDAKNNLRQALANLRKLLEPYLAITRDSVVFEPAGDWLLDTAQFEAFLQTARTAQGEQRPIAFQAAVDLYQGEFLAGFYVRDAPDFEEWMLAQRLRYHELALHTLHTLTDWHLDRGQYGRAIDYATRLLAIDGWREEAHRQLMLAQIRSGQRSAALAQYESCRRLLQQELGVEPSGKTTALYERIKGAEHRVSLPSPLTPFVGRDQELSHLAHLISDPNSRLITLIGPGGSGKTRLSIEAAGRVANRFLNGVCQVPLASVTSLEVVPTAIADSLAIILSGNANPADQLLANLRDKEYLLLLDNLEHLPGIDEIIGRLIEQCPEVRVLATSRERLNLRGERLMEIEGLDVPPTDGEPRLARFGAIQLFTNCAQDNAPEFKLTDQNEKPVGQICRLVEGLPLAIELAAAWVRQLSCEEIASEIRRNLDFLGTTQKNVPNRHRSIQATFNHSWTLLSKKEQQTLAALAVFQGGCTQKGALAITETHLLTLASLVDKSLVRQDTTGRYDLHELLRQFALRHLEETLEDAQAVRHRHSAYYLLFFATRETALGDSRQEAARTEINLELDNFRTAWRHALAWRLWENLDAAVESVRIYFEHSGLFGEGYSLFAMAVDALVANSREHNLLRAKCLSRMGWFAYRLDHFSEARQLIEEALDLLRSDNPPIHEEEALCQMILGNIARAVGDFEKSEAHARQSVILYRQTLNTYNLAAALNSQATAMAEMGRFKEAVPLHEESLFFKRQLGDQRGIATTLVNLGFAAISQGQYEQVQAFASEALEIFRSIGYRLGEAVALNNLGVAFYILESYDQAQQVLKASLEICHDLGHRHLAAHALGTLGGIAGARGDLKEGWRLTLSALKMGHEIGSISAVLFAIMSVAVLHARQGEAARAAELGGFVWHHPSSNREVMNRTENLFQSLEEQLPKPEIAHLLDRGRKRSLAEVVEGILVMGGDQD